MHILLDHISAWMISGCVILMVVSTQFNAQRSSVEQSIAYGAKAQILQMADMMEQELLLIGEGTDDTIETVTENDAGETVEFTFHRELRPSSSAEWNTDLIRSHLEFLNSETQEGRARGTRGFLRTADYIADQLKASQVQPFLRGQYKQQYAASVTHLARAEVLFLGSDTLNLVQGEDFFVFPGTDDVQLSPASQELLKDEKYALSRFVEQEERITTSSIHVVGYIPGRDPRSRDSLIVVFAQADGIGAQGAVSFTGGRDAGTGTAALLEVSRRLSTIQDQWSLLGPSVMVSFLSGSRLDCTGLESAMKNFPWQREYILNVIVLDESSHPTCRWEDLSPEIQIVRATSTESNEEAAPFSPYFLRSELLSDDNMLQLEAESLRLAKLVMASLMAK